MDIIETIKLFKEEANADCSCTSKQQTGEDVTVCQSCTAAGIINDIGEWLEREYLYYVNNIKK